MNPTPNLKMLGLLQVLPPYLFFFSSKKKTYTRIYIFRSLKIWCVFFLVGGGGVVGNNVRHLSAGICCWPHAMYIFLRLGPQCSQHNWISARQPLGEFEICSN